MNIMKQIKFSRAGKRRFNKRVSSLHFLLEQNEKLFLREWDKLVQNWLFEIHHRARDWREGKEFRNSESSEGTLERGRTHIYGILDIAEAYLKAAGETAELLVGGETRRVLTNECARTVASICDGRTNYLVDHRLYRRAKV